MQVLDQDAVRQFCARVRTDDLHEALVVALWIARRLIARTHAPGAIAAFWSDSFERAEEQRAWALKRAWAAARPAREG